MTPLRPTRPRRRRRVADRAATVVLLVVLGTSALVLTRVGGLVGMQADVCADDGITCDFSAVTAGALIARWVPLGVLVVTIAVTVRRTARRRTTFWVPLLGIGAVYGVLLLAEGVVSAAISRG